MTDFLDGVLIQRRIGKVRRKLLRVAILDLFFCIIGAGLLALGAGILADWIWDLPVLMRAMILAADLGILMWVGYRKGFLPISRLPDDEAIALQVQRCWPEVGDQLISAVQFSKPGGVDANCSMEMAGAVISGARQSIDRFQLTQVVSTEGIVKLGAGVLGVFIVMAAGFQLSGQWGVDLLKRALLSDTPVPRNTHLIAEETSRVMPIGETTVLKVQASGRVPREGTLEIRDESRKIAMRVSCDEKDIYEKAIENVQQSFEWRVKAGDNQTPWARVQAVARPAVGAIKFITSYPAYINKSSEERTPGNLLLPAGGKLRVEVVGTQKLSSAELSLVGLGMKVPMEGLFENFKGEFDVPVTGLTGLTVRMVNELGIESNDMTVYPVDILPDKAPAVRILRPSRRDITATAVAKVDIEFDAADDYGIDKIFLRRKLDNLKDDQAASAELDLSGLPANQRQEAHKKYRMDLGAMKLAEGEVLEVWLEAADGNTTTGPGVTASERFKVKIVSAAEKEAEVMNRLNEQLGSIDFVAEDQEKVNDSLVKWIGEKE